MNASFYDPGLGADLVREFIQRLTDALQSSRLRYPQLGTGAIPGVGGNLVPGDKVFHRRVMNSRPTFDIAEEQIHGVRNLRDEVVDISIPVAIVGRSKEQFCVVIQEDETHIVECANRVSTAEVTFQRLEQSAESRGSAFC